MTDLRALSIRQPWAHAIIYLGKDVENRSRMLGHRGPLLVHASAGATEAEYDDARDFMAAQGLPAERVPAFADLQRGGIVGVVNVTGCVDAAESPWWMGPRALTLTDARALPFTPCKGTVAPLFWKPDPSVVEQLSGLL